MSYFPLETTKLPARFPGTTPRPLTSALYDNCYNVMDYGVKADGTTNDAPAIQRAIDMCASGGGGIVYLPPSNKSYIISNTINITTIFPTQPITRPIIFQGGGLRTELFFSGPAANNISHSGVAGIKLSNASSCVLRDFSIRSQPGLAPDYGISVTVPEGGSTQHVLLENIEATSFPYGIAIGPDISGDVSEITLFNCLVAGCTKAGFLLGNGIVTNIINIRFYSCMADNNYAGVICDGPSYTWYGGTAQHSQTYDFVMLGAQTAPLVIDGVRSESSNAFFNWPSFGGFQMPVVIKNIYMSAWSGDGIVINYLQSAPVLMESCVFAFANTPARFTFAGPDPFKHVFINVGHNNSGTPFYNCSPGNFTLMNVYSIDDTPAVNGGAIPSGNLNNIHRDDLHHITTSGGSVLLRNDYFADFAINLNGNVTSTTIYQAHDGDKVGIEWIQDSTGNRSYSWPSGMKFAGGSTPTASTGVNTRDSFIFRSDNGIWTEISRSVGVK